MTYIFYFTALIANYFASWRRKQSVMVRLRTACFRFGESAHAGGKKQLRFRTEKAPEALKNQGFRGFSLWSW